MRGADQCVGLAIPHLFLELGLSDVTAEGVVQVHLLSDYRRSADDVTNQLDTEVGKGLAQLQRRYR